MKQDDVAAADLVQQDGCNSELLHPHEEQINQFGAQRYSGGSIWAAEF